MKEKFLKFIKDKFNIALIIIQVLAIVCYILSMFGVIFAGLFVALEGAFFVVAGCKVLVSIKDSKYSLDIVRQLPYTEEEKRAIEKKQESANKNNRFVAIIFLILGTVLFFSAFSLIF